MPTCAPESRDAGHDAQAVRITCGPEWRQQSNPLLMNRLNRVVLILSTLVCSWLGMQAVHESGHVIGAWATGATVERVVLHPAAISRTDVADASHPLVVVWAGPIIGAVLPILCWLAAAQLNLASTFLWRFFAGFCLIVNGAYIAFGSFEGVGDCGEMLQHGSPAWLLWLFGVLTIPLGLRLWHGQGKHFGLGPGKLEISSRLTVCVFLVALAILSLEMLVNGR